MSDTNEVKLKRIIKEQEWLMSALRLVRELRLPDWFIGGGAVRNTVWNYLHGYPTDSHQNDFDVVYFDPSDTEGKRGKVAEEILREKSPKFKWEVTNQALAHLYNKRPRVSSSSESIKYWSEIANCVGIRLEEDDSLTISAPYGVDDLMNLIVRPIPQPYQELGLYNKRVSEKKWKETWSMLKIEF